MSQSATIYRVSEQVFTQLEQSEESHFDQAAATDHVLFHGTFAALEYLLAKHQDAPATRLVHAIFNPQTMLGSEVMESNVSYDGQIEFFEVPLLYPYHAPAAVALLHAFLENVSAADIEARYDADELNRNKVYPEMWQKEMVPGKAYNKAQLVHDLAQLKKIIREANEAKDYLFVFIG